MVCRDLINQIEGIERKKYLELGVGARRNFDRVLCKDKTSVDINGRADFTGTTSEFFGAVMLTKRWDIVYIDACHDLLCVQDDFNNSIVRCIEWIIVHDMIPPSIRHCRSGLCSDSYRLLYYLLEETRHQVYPLNGRFGMTFIKVSVCDFADRGTVKLPDLYRVKSYSEFMEYLQTQRLYSDEEIVEILNA